MGEPPPTPAGILESLRRLGRTGVAVVQNRIELFAVEVEEQKVRVVRLLVLAGAAIFLGNTFLLTVSATIVVMVGDTARVPVLIGLSVIYLACTLWACLAVRKELRSAPPPFHETVSELKKDSQWLNPPN
jgi:uncharacterized membrane protein YqjE